VSIDAPGSAPEAVAAAQSGELDGTSAGGGFAGEEPSEAEVSGPPAAREAGEDGPGGGSLAAPSEPPPGADADADDRRSWFEHLRPCELRWVGVELPRAHPEVVLSEVDPPHRSLRFPIGYPEGIAISVAVRGVELPRPLTHDFLCEILRRLNVRVEALRILGMEQGNLVADVMLIGNQGPPMLVTCRPSDGLALVSRQSVPVPILVHEALLGFSD
jgi:bifunctional DNase/RNase